MFEFTLNLRLHPGNAHVNAAKNANKRNRKHKIHIRRSPPRVDRRAGRRRDLHLRFAPVWVFTWIARLLGRLKRLLQCGQQCLRSLSSAFVVLAFAAGFPIPLPIPRPVAGVAADGRVTSGASGYRVLPPRAAGTLEGICA